MLHCSAAPLWREQGYARLVVAVNLNILVSAGEASGDLYAAALVAALRRRSPETGFFGCAGPRMLKQGVRPVVEMASLAVVGVAEVVAHIPRIWREYRRLVAAAERERPRLAILVDSPDFHLRVARRLRKLGIPVVYLVAPQAWAWRRGRVHSLRRNVSRLLCIFPFEEDFFRRQGVAADYVGHPLARLVKPSMAKPDFFRKHRLPVDRPLIALLPGSRRGEIARHLPVLVEAVDRLYRAQAGSFVIGAAPGIPVEVFHNRLGVSPIQVIEGETWDLLAHADLALAASGTVTVEAALLGTPMVTFYKVTALSWLIGRALVRTPYFTMVNLVAGRRIVPELMQREATAEGLAAEAARLLSDSSERQRMRADLEGMAARLRTGHDPLERAAEIVEELLHEHMAHTQSAKAT